MSEKKRDFDKAAIAWDDEPRRVRLAADVVGAVMREVRVTGDMDVLDFGCGTGLVTLGLQPHVGSITGADTSRGMLEMLKKKAESLHNVSTLLLDPSGGPALDRQFDLVVSNMTLHHIVDIEESLNKLSDLLRPNGVLCIADLDLEDGNFHDDTTGVAHFGFNRERLLSLLRKAGLCDTRATTAAVITRKKNEVSRDYPVLLAVARKPLTD
jgi:ubiquinone/menaquinone biosynthesis C-methylase UbiE